MFGLFFGISIQVACMLVCIYAIPDTFRLTKKAFRDGLFDDDYRYEEEYETGA